VNPTTSKTRLYVRLNYYIRSWTIFAKYTNKCYNTKKTFHLETKQDLNRLDDDGGDKHAYGVMIDQMMAHT